MYQPKPSIQPVLDLRPFRVARDSPIPPPKPRIQPVLDLRPFRDARDGMDSLNTLFSGIARLATLSGGVVPPPLKRSRAGRLGADQ